MAGLRIYKVQRISSSTLVENLIALVIISFCLSVALLITSNLVKNLNENEFDCWLNQIRQISINDNSGLLIINDPNSNHTVLQPIITDSASTMILLKKIRIDEE